MFRELIRIVPFGFTVSFFMIFFLLLAYASMQVSVPFITFPVDKEHRRLSNILIGIMSSALSILLAFVIINAWNYQLKARVAVTNEADNIGILLHEIIKFAPKEQEKFMKLTTNYTVAVRIYEWESMKFGLESPLAAEAMNNLFDAIHAYIPKTDQEKFFYARAVGTINNLLQARRQRLNKIGSVIPNDLKYALILYSIAMVVILGLIRGEADFYNNMGFLFFALFIGFNLSLALDFDYPFVGDISVSNKAFYSGLLGNMPDF